MGLRRMTLEEALDALARDAACHVVGEPATDRDLQALDAALGRALPASFRALLRRLGGGLFYQGHEIFGTCRVMVHDIELVPSITSVRSQLGARLPDGVVPFHRDADAMHAFDLRRAAHAERVVTVPEGGTYPDLASFLQAVVLPPPA